MEQRVLADVPSGCAHVGVHAWCRVCVDGPDAGIGIRRSGQAGQVVVVGGPLGEPVPPVGTYGSGLAPPLNRSPIHVTMSSIDTGITPEWLWPG